MKNYEKPKLMVLSLSANDALCIGCGIKTRFDSSSSILDSLYGDGNGFFTPDESAGMFAESEEACKDLIHVDINGYCKFTGADSQKLFTS